MFHVPVVKHGVNGHLRQKGKIAELALGYGGSVGALKAMGALNYGLTEEELKPLVDAWRQSNPRIVKFWWDVDRAATTCVRDRVPAETHGIRFLYQSGMMFIVLPSGRKLVYVKPKMGVNRYGSESVTYEGVGEQKKWLRLESYGPKFVENIVQATARDILVEAMRRLEAAGYQIVMHVHDEAVIEAPADTSLDDICAIMGQTPAWAEGLLLRADGYVADLTESVEGITGELTEEQENLRLIEGQMSQLQQSVDGLSITMQEQYSGGINFVRNSAGLNGLSDDWTYAGTITAQQGAETKNSTVSNSCLQLAAYSTLTQVVDSIVPGQAYRLTVKAKKTSTYNAYVRAIINGDTEIDLFNTSESFEWTEYTALLPDVQDSVITIKIYSRDASLFVSDIMLTEGATLHKWTPAPNEIYTSEVKIDRRGIEVSNADSAQRTVINNTEFSGYYNEEKIFSLNKDETITKKTTVDGELTVGKTKFVPMATASEGLNIVILD